ncbi:SNF2-related protein [Flavobacterium sp.]|jgi:SNF2 family DNA or RNA helicase|uniref:SNF2-related protein n=1 Tax=Flavobacterium sp. TaxID=239 RepID=UPI0037C0A470
MDITAIKKYIKLHSNPNSRSNANYVYPIITEYSSTKFEFECEGSYGDYIIKIDIENNNISTSCTCPYKNSYSGICKHVIASLKIIIEDYNGAMPTVVPDKDLKAYTLFEELPFEKANNSENNKLKTNQTKLINGVITLNTINNWKVSPRYRGYGYDDYKIVAASQTEVTTKNSGWTSCQQTFKYDPETEILEFECSCTKTKKSCEHISKALEEINNVFGENLFATDYYEENIKFAIAKYGFTIDDDYDSIFSFKISPKGFETKIKAKNITTDSRDYSKIFKTAEVETIINLPAGVNKDDDFGLGVCFEFERKKFQELILFQAKYNKTRTDFSSSITRINTYNLEDTLMVYSSAQEQSLIVKTMQINTAVSKFKSSRDVNYLKKAIDANKELLAILQEKFSYTYDSSKTLVCKNLTPCSYDSKTIKLFFTINETAHFYTLKAKVSLNDKNYNLDAAAIQITPLYIFVDNVIVPINDAKLSIYLNHFSNYAEINYLKKDTPDFFEKIVKPISEKFEIQTEIFKKSKAKIEESAIEKHVYITDFEGQYIVFKPAVQYPNQLIPVFSNEILVEELNKDEANKNILFQERNQSFEDNFIEEFRGLHPAFAEQDEFFFLTPDQLMENYWMIHATDRMHQQEMKVFGANNLKSFKFNLNKAVIKVNLKSDIDWFDIEIDISFGNQKAGLKELQKAFLKKSNYVALGDGTLGILPEDWMKKFSNYFKVGEIKKDGIKISNYQFGIIDELFEEIEKKPPFLVELLEKKKRLQNISNIEEIAIPKGIKAKLREYQHHGLNWLAFLDKYQLGGCLADDMGLGKTLQAITFLQYLKLKDKKCLPSLIIAPTSLIFNWKNEIAKFCPTLKMLVFVGGNRMENKDDFSKYDLIISTYGSLLNDVEFMKDFKFNYIILDESQAIKNPNSKRYKAVRLLKSYNRLVLTGTPIENNTFDLYAQMNFINPGLLGNMTHFKTQFSDAIDKEKNHEASYLLSKMIAPFLLRRTKEQVAKELPEKTESIIYCEMGNEQRKVYDSFKNKYRDYLINKIDENGVENAQMYILEGLTKLRQICNSPALISDEEDYGNQSVKLDLLLENIKEKTGNHKILVFSQFVKMLQLIKTRLDEEQIYYEYLDGQTTNREDKVNNFQNNKDVRVFLISLKAGGTGLNLTEADYVFLVDPWWNPAVENQAIDRCYRIGQKQKVMAYRMICKDTIEEKITLLQGKKKAVATSIIAVDEEKKSFDVDQVKSFFS